MSSSRKIAFLVILYCVLYPGNCEIDLQIDFEKFFEGDMKDVTIEEINRGYMSGHEARRRIGNVQNAAVISQLELWPKNQVFCQFDLTTFTYWKREAVKRAMRTIESVTCVKFIQRTNEANFVHIFTESSGACWSNVGYIGNGAQYISLSDKCLENQDDILHELMHTLGFFHEHNRYDRDDFINLDLSRLSERIRPENFRKYDQSTISHQNTRYDYYSVMHYPPLINGHLVFTPKQQGVQIRSNGLSATDIVEINQLYPCKKDKCSAGRFYCGSQLEDLDYSGTYTDTLYYCDGEYGNYHYACGPNRCKIRSVMSFCSCVPGALYCGHELIRLNFVFAGLRNNTLYVCRNETFVDIRSECTYQCAAAVHSFCRSSEQSSKCKPYLLYCGYELADIGHRNAITHNIYQCSTDFNGNFFQGCPNGCVQSSHNSSCSTASRMVSQWQ